MECLCSVVKNKNNLVLSHILLVRRHIKGRSGGFSPGDSVSLLWKYSDGAVL